MRITRIMAIVFTGMLLVVAACAKPTLPEPTPTTPITPPTTNMSPPPPSTTPAPNPPPPPNIPIPAHSPAPIPSPGPNEIWVLGSEFKPSTIIVSEGITVTWINKDSVTHRITPSIMGANGMISKDPVTNKFIINGNFFDGFLLPGNSTSLTLVTGGTFYYYCEDKPDIVGMIVVGG